jgi:hypothetical protein
MRGMLAGGDDAVMAGVARADDLRMIDGHHGRKDIRRVAVFTDIGRLNVPAVLSGGLRTVMAAYTVTGDVDVIEIRGQPADRAVTVIAIVAACDVRRVLAGGDDAVMARPATPDYLRVIDCHHGCKRIRAVAIFTDIGRLNVPHVFTGCIRAVMAGAASTQNLCVFYGSDWRKSIRVVAVFTDVSRLNVSRVFAGRLDTVMATYTIINDARVFE